ncbi:MAG: hypothetical protein QG602_2735 [Verrucomicrobiota bacterium]|nr:hypothetical protein [Verrucomicrobiota bacterium]
MRRVTPAFVVPLLVLLPAVSRAGIWELITGRRDLEVITVTELSGRGQFLPPASPDQPQYYIAASLGYRDLGASIAGFSEPPHDKDVIHLISSELAKQGFLPAKTDSKPPSLLLVYTWGTLNAERFYGPDPSRPSIQANHRQMVRFLGGAKVGLGSDFFNPLTAPIMGLTAQSFDAQNIYDVAREDLYVMIVAAYDLESALERKRQPPLWITRIAAPSLGFSFSNVLPSMLSIGGQQFGRDTPRPVWVNATDKFKPTVRLGELQLLEYMKGETLPVVDVSDAPLEKK